MSEDRDNIEGAARGSGRRWLVAVILAVMLLAGGVIATTQLQSPRYFAKVTIQVKEDRTSNCYPYHPDYAIAFAESQIRLIERAEMLLPVIEKLHLGQILKKGAEPLPTEKAYALLKRSLAIRTLVPNTDLIEIGAYSNDPVLAASIANTIADVYRDKRIGATMEMIERSIASLEAQVQKHRTAVDKAAVEAANLRNQEGILDPDPESYAAPISAPKGKNSASAYMDAKSRYLQQRKYLETGQRNLQAERMFQPPSPVKILEKAEPPSQPVRFWLPRLW